MSEAEGLRERAARLLAMALTSRDEGDVDRADLLVSHANSYIERAEILEQTSRANFASTKTSPHASEHVCSTPAATDPTIMTNRDRPYS